MRGTGGGDSQAGRGDKKGRKLARRGTTDSQTGRGGKKDRKLVRKSTRDSQTSSSTLLTQQAKEEELTMIKQEVHRPSRANTSLYPRHTRNRMDIRCTSGLFLLLLLHCIYAQSALQRTRRHSQQLQTAPPPQTASVA